MDRYAYNPSGFGTDDFDTDIWDAQYNKAMEVAAQRHGSLTMGESSPDEFLVIFPESIPVREQYRVLYDINTILEVYGIIYKSVWSNHDGDKNYVLGDENDPFAVVPGHVVVTIPINTIAGDLLNMIAEEVVDLDQQDNETYGWEEKHTDALLAVPGVTDLIHTGIQDDIDRIFHEVAWEFSDQVRWEFSDDQKEAIMEICRQRWTEDGEEE